MVKSDGDELLVMVVEDGSFINFLCLPVGLLLVDWILMDVPLMFDNHDCYIMPLIWNDQQSNNAPKI